jgi:hypothetical protein
MGGYAEDLAYAGGGYLEFAARSKHLYVAGERDDLHSYGAALACTRDIARREQVADVFTSDFSFAAAPRYQESPRLAIVVHDRR